MPRRLAALSAFAAAAAASTAAAAAITFGGIGVGTSGASGVAAQRPAAALGGVHLGGVLLKDGPARFGSQASSENWSGYAVTPSGGHVTGVSGTFVVPAAGLVLPGLASTWAGIGGDGTPDLIQAGVAESSFPSLPILGPQYYAWYELLPAGPVPLTGCVGDPSCAVHPGDQVAVKITQVGPTQWSITEVDSGHWSWTDADITYASQNASAEWILEAPTVLIAPLDLAGTGVVRFGPYSSYSVSNGAPRTIASGNPTAIAMNLLGLGLITEATPSGLAADGQSFDVCAYASSCAPPA